MRAERRVTADAADVQRLQAQPAQADARHDAHHILGRSCRSWAPSPAPAVCPPLQFHGVGARRAFESLGPPLSLAESQICGSVHVDRLLLTQHANQTSVKKIIVV